MIISEEVFSADEFHRVFNLVGIYDNCHFPLLCYYQSGDVYFDSDNKPTSLSKLVQKAKIMLDNIIEDINSPHIFERNENDYIQ